MKSGARGTARAAVAGGGPAGIAVGAVLAREGFAVTIFDSKDELNGAMRYGTPEFRLPRTVLCRIARWLAEMDKKFRASTTIGGALEIGDLMRDGYGAVFVGAGIWRPRTLGMRGKSLANVHCAMAIWGIPTYSSWGRRLR